jgi:uncharacterized Ntn-hydrolase superfamily protein
VFRACRGLGAAVVLAAAGAEGDARSGGPPPVSTFSIVARDPATGEIGVAVQSKVVAVGAIVPWAEAGVGAVATQSVANVLAGPAGLDGLRAGLTPEDCLERLLGEDPLREHRQIAVLGAEGRPAVFTGEACHPTAGHRIGDDFAVQGNLLAGEEVLHEMERAFRETAGELADRMIAALRAGQAAGGDRRGRQSAALLVVRQGWGYGGQGDRYRDLRVDDAAEPVEELARIHELHRALFPRPEDQR